MADNVTDAEVADAFVLEDIFPSPAELFAPHTPISAGDDNVIIVLDANALLLPYEIKAGNLTALRDVYVELSKKSRLYVPDRVVREFGRNRDTKLAALIKALEDRRSRDLPASDMPPLLESLSAFQDATKGRNELSEVQKRYMTALNALTSEMKKWRGDDPIIKMYSEVLKPKIIGLPLAQEARKEILKEWRWRLRNKVPPGYKDASKDDSGIGDFLIWKILLKLGEEQKKDLAFVTGEQKADWFTRSSGEGIYPRLELLDEYRRASGGRSLRLMSLYELLSEMKVAGQIVAEVKTAEDAANTAIMVSSSEAPDIMVGQVGIKFIGKKVFDYSTHNGLIEVRTDGRNFDLRFTKASDRSIYLHKGTNVSHIARVKSATTGQLLRLQDYDSTSSAYVIERGEHFLARNAQGYVLGGKIIDIKDDTRGAQNDEVTFVYSITSDIDGAVRAF